MAEIKSVSTNQEGVDHSPALTLGSNLLKRGVICQGFSRSLVAGISQASHQNIVRNI